MKRLKIGLARLKVSPGSFIHRLIDDSILTHQVSIQELRMAEDLTAGTAVAAFEYFRVDQGQNQRRQRHRIRRRVYPRSQTRIDSKD